MQDLSEFLAEIGKSPSYGKLEINLLESSHLTFGQVVVSKATIDLMAAAIRSADAAVRSGEVSGEDAMKGILEVFAECFPSGDASRFIGD